MEENSEFARLRGAEQAHIGKTQSLRRDAAGWLDEDLLGMVLKRGAQRHSAIGEEPTPADGPQPKGHLLGVGEGVGRRRLPAPDGETDHQSDDGYRGSSEEPRRPARKDA
jgi:hypothetical protein